MATIILKVLGQGGNLDSQFRGQVRQKIPLPTFHTGSWEPRSRGYQVLLVSEVIGSLNRSVRETNRQGECVLLFFLLLKKKKDKSSLKKEGDFSVPVLRIVFHGGGRHSGRNRRPLVTSYLSSEADRDEHGTQLSPFY